jgi:Protein of unknown function (DUF4058)
MPIHDWTLVDAGLFHAFHHRWITALSDALNSGVLPVDYYALPERNIRGPIPDVLTLKAAPTKDSPESSGGIAVAITPPQIRHVRRNESSLYADKADRIAVRHRHGDVVSMIEIVSPGNKGSRSEFKAFVDKSVGLIRQKVHLLAIDLFPPTKRDPQGIYKAIWDEFDEDDYVLPPNHPLTLASFDAGPPQVAYVENVGVGDRLPDMPLFLEPEVYVHVPLEQTYQTTWNLFPSALKGLLEPVA